MISSKGESRPVNKSEVLCRYSKCPFCKEPMEWDDLIKEYECPVCRVTESELDDMPYEMICSY